MVFAICMGPPDLDFTINLCVMLYNFGVKKWMGGGVILCESPEI